MTQCLCLHLVLVDPGKLTLDFLSSGPLGYRDAESNQRAKGVITVTIRGSPPEKKSDCAGDDVMMM